MSIDFKKPLINDPYEYFDTTIAQEFFRTMLKDRLDHGMSRSVFSVRHDENIVVKFEVSAGFFQNVQEWEMSKRLENSPMVRWIAPCISISGYGSVLIQARTTKPPADYKWPLRIPSWFTDTKKSNFGLLGGRLVCHDYAINRTVNGAFTKRMTKADWWDTNDS